MSQAGVITSGGAPPPPGTDISFDLDVGMTTSVGSVMNVVGASDFDENDNGIYTNANPNLSDNTEIVLSNRRVDTDSVTGATTVDLFTQDLGGTAGTYNFQVYVAGYENTTPASCAYTIFGAIRTNGATATLIITQDIISDEETALLDADMELVVSGNNAILRATGVAGLTINYKALATYIFVGSA